MAERSPHEILGVALDASPDALRRAFRAIARTCHPDVRGEDAAAAATFRAAREAYEQLTDPARRAASDPQPARPARSRADREAFFSAMMRRAARGDGSGSGDPFESMFAGADASPRASAPADPADPFADPLADEPGRAPMPTAGPTGPADAVVDVSVVEAMLGAWIEVDAPAGPTRAVLPPSSSSGTRITLDHRGRSEPSGLRGAWTVEVRIVVPDDLDEGTRALVRELAARLPRPRR